MALDFSGQNLRGRNFKGRQDLVGVNFSYADIRGANFSGANLTRANFSHAKAGLQRRWVIGLVVVSFLLSALSGFLWAFDAYLVWQIFDSSNTESQIMGWFASITLISFYIITIRQGFTASLGTVAFIFAFAVAGTAAFAFVFALTFAVAVAFAVAGTAAFAFVFAFVGSVAIAVAGIVAFAFAFVVAGILIFAFVFAFALVFTSGTVTIAVAFAVAGTLLSIYIAWQAMTENEKYSLIRNIAIAFAATGSTNFRYANLTNADFTQATLKSTDFRNTILTRTRYHQAKMLDLVRPGSTYLQHAQVQQLIVTGKGQDQNFDGQNLRGINLQNANLADASFICADLREASLQDADLLRAKLKQTQLDATDLTGATLTGAFIEDWGITRETKLHGVRCEYVFMRLPIKTNPDPLRKPDNQQEVFQDGDFAEFIQPIFETLDLYHNQDVDPHAIAIAFNNLAQKHPEAQLKIVAMEKRGDDKLLIRSKTAEGIDKSQLSAEYFEDYNQLKALSQSQQLLVSEKDSYILISQLFGLT